MAPEILNDEKYNRLVDVWSLGCILYKLCTFNNIYPQKVNNYIQIAKYAKKMRSPPKIPHGYSNNIKYLLKVTLSNKYKRRADVIDILKLPFIACNLERYVSRMVLRKEGLLDLVRPVSAQGENNQVPTTPVNSATDVPIYQVNIKRVV